MSSRRSGSFQTFKNIDSTIAKKIKLRFEKNPQILREILDYSEKGKCLFAVTRPESDLMRYIQNIGHMKIIPIKLNESHGYKKATLTHNELPGLIKKGEEIETFSVDTYFVQGTNQSDVKISNVKADILKEYDGQKGQNLHLCLGDKGTEVYNVGKRFSADFENIVNHDLSKIKDNRICDITLRPKLEEKRTNEIVIGETAHKMGMLLLCRGSSSIVDTSDLMAAHKINILSEAPGDLALWSQIQSSLLTVDYTMEEARRRFEKLRSEYREKYALYKKELANGNRKRERLEELFSEAEEVKNKVRYFRRQMSMNKKSTDGISRSVNRFQLVGNLVNSGKSCIFKTVNLDKDERPEGTFASLLRPIKGLAPIAINKELTNFEMISVSDSRLKDLRAHKVTLPVVETELVVKENKEIDSQLVDRIYSALKIR